MNAQLNQYLRQVEQFLMDCPKKERLRIREGLAQEMEDFGPQMAGCTLEDLEEIFGAPEEVAQQLLDAVPLKVRLEVRQKKWAHVSMAFAVLCALLTAMGYWCWLVSHEHIEIKTYESEPIVLSNEEFEKLFGDGLFKEEEPNS